ncbi:MAG: AraC family transcriptional regulator [Caulobacterales bacterium]
MAQGNYQTSESIIIDALGRLPDIQLGSDNDGWRLCRWRQFVGTYSLPALPDPVFTVHIAGKPQVKTWDRDGWSEISSVPGCATIVPSGQETGWLVDGELDVVTLSVSSKILKTAPAADQFRRMRFAFADPLGVALTRQILAELYAPPSPERDVYVGAMVNALKAHILRGPSSATADNIPISAFSAYRLHHIMNAILQKPEGNHSLEEMSAQAGITPSHFCRVFRKATGISPHQYVMKTRLDRAQQMLTQSDLGLSTIADFLGFASQSHFTRAFRNYVGETPSDFRKRGRKILQ